MYLCVQIDCNRMVIIILIHTYTHGTKNYHCGYKPLHSISLFAQYLHRLLIKKFDMEISTLILTEGSEVCIVERLFSSSLVALVELSNPRKLRLCHFKVLLLSTIIMCTLIIVHVLLILINVSALEKLRDLYLQLSGCHFISSPK